MIDPHNRSSCDICGSADARYLWSLRFDAHPCPFTLWRCHGCGVVFNSPRLDPEAIHQQYDSDYYIFAVPPARRWARAAQLYRQLLLPFESRSAGRRLLDIGCARGELLAIARRRGWDVQGIELSPEPAEFARREYGLPVEIGTVEDVGPHLDKFDVAIAADVIEHVPSPGGFLECIRRVLNAGGRAIIETPNWGSLWRRVGGQRWLGLNRFHIHLWDAPALSGLMRACGFRNSVAASSTHVAHTTWGDRPELQAAIRHLPAGLQWRTQRWLNQASAIRSHAGSGIGVLDSLDAAVASISRAPSAGHRDAGLLGDNLAVTGRRY